MPDFIVSTKIVARDQVAPAFMKAEGAVDRFGKKADASFDRASRSSKTFLRGFLGGLNKIESRIQGVFGIGGGILAADIIRAGVRGLAREVGLFIGEAANIQRATTEFGVFLRSAEKGKKVIADLRALGARTPFEFKDFIRSTKLLLASESVTQKELIPTLNMLGDTASGSADKLNRIAFAFSEVKNNSKASFQEIRQFTNAGVPMLATVARMWKKSGETTQESLMRTRKMIRAGKLTGEVMTKAFKIMTSEGGLFFKAMDKTSRDFLGRLSTLRENIDFVRSAIGDALLPILTKYVNRGIKIAQMMTQWAQNNNLLIEGEFNNWLDTGEQILKDMWPVAKGVFGVFRALLPVIRELSPILPVLAAGWLANKTALGGLAALKAAEKIWGIVIAVRAAGTAQAFWNAMIIANPIGLIVTGVILGLTAIVVGIVLIVRNWDFLVGKMESGMALVTQVFFGFFRIAMWPFIAGLRLIALGISKIGAFTGMQTVEKEFAGLVRTLDDLDIKLRRAAGQLPEPFKIAENFIQKTRTKFGGIIPVQFKADFVEPGSVESVLGFGVTAKKPPVAESRPPLSEGSFTELIQRTIIKEELGRFPIADIGLLPRDFNQDLRAREKSDTSFNVTAGVVESFNEQKTIVEHVVKLIIPGADGKDSTITLAPGSEAPPVEIDLLGLN